jgi:hypothetical protein
MPAVLKNNTDPRIFSCSAPFEYREPGIVSSHGMPGKEPIYPSRLVVDYPEAGRI